MAAEAQGSLCSTDPVEDARTWITVTACVKSQYSTFTMTESVASDPAQTGVGLVENAGRGSEAWRAEDEHERLHRRQTRHNTFATLRQLVRHFWLQPTFLFSGSLLRFAFSPRRMDILEATQECLQNWESGGSADWYVVNSVPSYFTLTLASWRKSQARLCSPLEPIRPRLQRHANHRVSCVACRCSFFLACSKTASCGLLDCIHSLGDRPPPLFFHWFREESKCSRIWRNTGRYHMGHRL